MLKLIFNKLLAIVLLLQASICFSQKSIDSSKLRKKVEFIKRIVKTNAGVDKNIDTTHINLEPSKLDFINEFEYLSNDDLVDDYINAVFSGKESGTISQFIKPIKIFIDPKLPKDIKKDFISFVNDIPKINNLSISFVKNIDDSNYFIEITDDNFFGYSKKVLEKTSEENKNQLVFEKIKRITFRDNNKNIYACRLSLSPNIFDDDNVKTKLKKAFFITLGNFKILKYGAPKGSVLDFKTAKIDTLNPDDILILKMHYFYLYDFSVDVNTFFKFIKIKTKN